MSAAAQRGDPARRGSVARALGLGLALSLSILPLISGQRFEAPLGDASRLAMAWTPWIVVAGWPGGPGARRDWPFLLALALPAVALAAWFDRLAGLGLGRLEATFAAGLVVCMALGEARARAAGAQLRSYTPLWLLLLGVLPTLSVSVAWGGGQRLTDAGLAGWLRSLSPLTTLWRDVQPVEGDLARQGIDSAVFCASTLACLALLAWSAAAAARKAR